MEFILFLLAKNYSFHFFPFVAWRAELRVVIRVLVDAVADDARSTRRCLTRRIDSMIAAMCFTLRYCVCARSQYGSQSTIKSSS